MVSADQNHDDDLRLGFSIRSRLTGLVLVIVGLESGHEMDSSAEKSRGEQMMRKLSEERLVIARPCLVSIARQS